MSDRVTMPALGESVTEGTVTRWLKQVGDDVAVDEPLLEVSTDKVDTEIPSPFAGKLTEILVQEDETVEVGADLAVIGGDAPVAAPAAPATEASEESASSSQSNEATESSADSDSSAEAPVAEVAPPAEAPAPAAPADTSGSAGAGGERVKMPALGESVTEGTVTRWLKQVGDQVAVDEPLLEVSTDKVDTEIPSPVAGTLTEILVQEDETVDVGADLAVIGGGGAPSSSTASEAASEVPASPSEQAEPEQAPPSAPVAEPAAAPVAAPVAQVEVAEPAAEPAAAQNGGGDSRATAPAVKASRSGDAEDDASDDATAYVTPLVRKLAQQHGIELSSVAGTGIGGRIRKQDILDAAAAQQGAAQTAATPAAAASATPAPAQAATSAPVQASAGPDHSSKRGSTEKMSRLRKVIAARMVESLQVSAQLTTVVEVDMSKVARLRARAKGDFEQREGTKLSFLPFIAAATVDALKAHPNVNASVDGDNIVYHGSENLSIAVDTDKGLLVPVVKNAGDLNIAGLARAIADVADRTRNNKITPDDLAGGTFTITNTGSRGALFDTPIINQPQVAILGTGAIVKRPVVVADGDGGETIAIRSMMYLALSYDHRIVDGADAARFLGDIKQKLEEGNFESSLGL